MEFRRCIGEKGACWTLSGSMDDDSYLELESMIMNSQDRGADLELDVSGLDDISMTGARGLREIARRFREQGSDLRIVGASEEVERRFKILGILDEE